jgi:predicted RNase H-like nuclease (RuvC/YqgF family)
MQDEDKTYENEVIPTSDDRGSLDLTKQIDELTKKVKNLDGLEKIHRKTNGDLRLHILKLDREIYELKKDIAFQKETYQIDMIQKDNEIGRLIKKITENGDK